MLLLLLLLLLHSENQIVKRFVPSQQICVKALTSAREAVFDKKLVKSINDLSLFLLFLLEVVKDFRRCNFLRILATEFSKVGVVAVKDGSDPLDPWVVANGLSGL